MSNKINTIKKKSTKQQTRNSLPIINKISKSPIEKKLEGKINSSNIIQEESFPGISTRTERDWEEVERTGKTPRNHMPIQQQNWLLEVVSGRKLNFRGFAFSIFFQKLYLTPFQIQETISPPI